MIHYLEFYKFQYQEAIHYLDFITGTNSTDDLTFSDILIFQKHWNILDCKTDLEVLQTFCKCLQHTEEIEEIEEIDLYSIIKSIPKYITIISGYTIFELTKEERNRILDGYKKCIKAHFDLYISNDHKKEGSRMNTKEIILCICEELNIQIESVKTLWKWRIKYSKLKENNECIEKLINCKDRELQLQQYYIYKEHMKINARL